MDEVAEIPLEQAAQYVGMIYLQGMEIIGAHHRREAAEWFQKPAWEAVAASVNDLPDGEVKAADLALQIRTKYLLEAGIAEPPEILPGELVVWEAIARALAMLVEVGALTPEQTAEAWAAWITDKLNSEGYHK